MVGTPRADEPFIILQITRKANIKEGNKYCTNSLAPSVGTDVVLSKINPQR